MEMPPRLFLVVTQGPSLGARLLVEDTPRFVGRASDADLTIADITVSRKHLEVVIDDRFVVIRCAPGAAHFYVDSVARTEARLAPGNKIVLGNSVLTVGQQKSLPTDVGDVTDARSLSGFGGDIRGLSAVYALVDALEAVSGVRELADVFDRWARTHLGVSRAVLVTEPTADAPGGLTLVEDRLPTGGPRLAVRAGGGGVSAILFEYERDATLDDPSRRLASVASRIFLAIFGERTAARSAERDRNALRKLAIGSATEFLGTSEAARRVAAILPKLSASDATVLLLGESGVGKTFVARLIHEASRRARAALTVINCAAIPENLVESELFGHERGAFTGADAARPGAFELAGDGTLLLDEIGELPLPSQAKLLRVLEERRFERVGSQRSIQLRARIITATNRDLESLVSAGRFRADLYFRISVVTTTIPPLRERADDLVGLAERLLADLAASAGRRVGGFSPDALSILRGYTWPGNVRELRNALEHALVLGEGSVVESGDLPEILLRATPLSDATVSPSPSGKSVVELPANLEWLERQCIAAALVATGGNRTRAAALLGINRATLYKKGRIAG